MKQYTTFRKMHACYQNYEYVHGKKGYLKKIPRIEGNETVFDK